MATEARVRVLNPTSAMFVQIQLQQMGHGGTGVIEPDCPACKKFRPQLWRWMKAHYADALANLPGQTLIATEPIEE